MNRVVIQPQMIDWIKTQGTWAVLFIALVMWAKPHADNLIEAHVTLIKSLQQNQETISKAIVELKSLIKESKLMRESMDNQTQINRSNSHLTSTPTDPAD